MTTKSEYYRGVTGEILVSVREARIVVERFLSVAGVPMGAVAPIRDFVVDAEVLGLEALKHLDRDFEEMAAFGPVRWSAGVSGVLSVDGLGRPALLVAADVLDLAVATAFRSGAAILEVQNVAHARFLAALTASAYQHGVHLDVRFSTGELWVSRGRDREPLARRSPDGRSADPDGPTSIVCSLGSAEGRHATATRVESAAMRRALRDGFQVDAELWWSLWDRANRALAPDSVLSRTHAGASVYDDAGQLLGELGEEWDDGYVPPALPPDGATPEVSSIARTRPTDGAGA